MSQYPLQVSVTDYPEFSNLIPGEEVSLTIKARVGNRILGGQDDVMSFVVQGVSLIPSERRYSPTEFLLSRIASHTSQINTPVP